MVPKEFRRNTLSTEQKVELAEEKSGMHSQWLTADSDGGTTAEIYAPVRFHNV